MHQSSGRWKLGLALSLVTAVLWGMLPIALKGILSSMDATTITWYRFIVSLFFVALMLMRKNDFPSINKLRSFPVLYLTLIVIVGLCGNYIFYLMGLDLVTPSAAQIVIQIAPLLLLFGGLVFFKEQFTLLQWFGVLLFVIGLILFFNHKIATLIDQPMISEDANNYTWGLVLVVFGGVTWAAYALAQKQLLKTYNSQQIMFMIYLVASIVFFPSSNIMSVKVLTNAQWGLLIFCCLNTVVAYGCFAEALDHWEASRVGSVLSIIPLMTIVFAYWVDQVFPNYIPVEPFNFISIVGALILVIGSLFAALSKKRRD